MRRIVLSALGRHEAALAAAEEAVSIRRELAKSSSDTFLPDLARSLHVLGSCLRAVSRPQDTTEAFREGIQILEPFLDAFPDAFRRLAAGLAKGYLDVGDCHVTDAPWNDRRRVAGDSFAALTQRTVAMHRR